MKITNNVNSQKVLDYILYMMVGSIFHSCKETKSIREKQLHLQYCESKDRDRQRMEDAAAYLADEILAAKLPEQILDAGVTAKMTALPADRTRTVFHGEHFSLTCLSREETTGRFEVIVELESKEGRQIKIYEVTNKGDYRRTEGGKENITVDFLKGYRTAREGGEETGQKAENYKLSA